MLVADATEAAGLGGPWSVGAVQAIVALRVQAVDVAHAAAEAAPRRAHP